VTVLRRQPPPPAQRPPGPVCRGRSDRWSPGRRVTGHLGDTLRHGARRTQRYIHTTVQPGSEPTRYHRVVVTYPYVVRVCRVAQAAAVLPGPDQRDTPALQCRADSRIAGQLMEGLSGYRRCLFGPLGHQARGGLPGSGERPHRVILAAAHHQIVSSRTRSDQPAPAMRCRPGDGFMESRLLPPDTTPAPSRPMPTGNTATYSPKCRCSIERQDALAASGQAAGIAQPATTAA